MTSTIHPTAIVSPKAELGDGVEIGAFCTVGPDVTLDSHVRLVSHISITGHTSVGAKTIIYPFAAIGHPPQDNKYRDEPTTLLIGQRNTIREHVSFHRGTMTGRQETRIGDDNLFMVGSHVAHDCIVGNKTTFANNATLGGMVEIEDNVILGGLSAVHQLGRVGQGAFIGGGAPVTGDVIPFGMVNNHGRLHGLNLVGLQRRGVDRQTINGMRRAYRLLFSGEGRFEDRMQFVADQFSDNENVKQILDFIEGGKRRPICMPRADP